MSSYVLVIGFHHKKGTSVEYVYPELKTGLDLPPSWAYIPSTALPDGAHNYDKDYIFFIVPSLEQKPTTLFGVACYRQVDAKKFSNQTPDLTRNTVQKSVVFLSPAALFGAVSHLLDVVTDAFISASSTKEGYEILRRGFEDIQTAVNKIVRSPIYENALLQDLSAVSFVRAYQREALVLLKLLLLERKVLFACETAVHCMSTWLLTLTSLIPGMLNGGLSTCALIDETWVGERACWPLAILSRSALNVSPANPDGVSATDVALVSASDDNEESSAIGEESSTAPVDLAQSANINSTRVGALRTVWSNVTKSASSVLNSRSDPVAEQPPSSNYAPHQMRAPHAPSDSSTSPASNDVYSGLPPLVDGSVFDSPLPTDDWGLPLSLFFRSYLFLPYVPLHALDMLLEFRRQPEGDIAPDPLALGGRRVRGFLCGTTNPLLSQNTRLAEVIVNTLPFPSEISGRDIPVEGNLEIAGDSEMESSDPSQKGPSLNKPGGVFSRLLNRQQSTIRICPSSQEPGSSLRDLPLPLSRALHLSRLDRIFIDHLVDTVELWHSAKAAKDADSNTLAAGSEEITPKQIAEAEVLSRLPELADLEKWIRAQFAVYLKSLLLTSDGRAGPLDDFNLNYVACLRTTHNFLAWRSQLIVPSVMKQMAEQQKQQQEEEQEKAGEGDGRTISSQVGRSGTQSSEAENPHASLSDIHGSSAKDLGSVVTSAARDIYAIGCPLVHPGRNLPSFEPAEQIVKNLKQFGSFAADHGRRMMNQWVNGLMKLGNEKNASGGASIFANSMRRFASNVRSTLDSVQSPPPPATSEEPKKLTKFQGQQQQY